MYNLELLMDISFPPPPKGDRRVGNKRPLGTRKQQLCFVPLWMESILGLKEAAGDQRTA